MNTMVINQEVEEANEEKKSRIVQDDSNLKQALRQWQDHLAFIKQQQEDTLKSNKQLAKERSNAEHLHLNLLLGLGKKRKPSSDDNDSSNDTHSESEHAGSRMNTEIIDLEERDKDTAKKLRRL